MNDFASGVQHMPDPYREAARLATTDPRTVCPNVVRGDEGTAYCSLNCQHDALRITDPDTGEPMTHARAWKIVAAVFAESHQHLAIDCCLTRIRDIR